MPVRRSLDSSPCSRMTLLIATEYVHVAFNSAVALGVRSHDVFQKPFMCLLNFSMYFFMPTSTAFFPCEASVSRLLAVTGCRGMLRCCSEAGRTQSPVESADSCGGSLLHCIDRTDVDFIGWEHSGALHGLSRLPAQNGHFESLNDPLPVVCDTF